MPIIPAVLILRHKINQYYSNKEFKNRKVEEGGNKVEVLWKVQRFKTNINQAKVFYTEIGRLGFLIKEQSSYITLYYNESKL
jgi:hypothetical protein